MHTNITQVPALFPEADLKVPPRIFSAITRGVRAIDGPRQKPTDTNLHISVHNSTKLAYNVTSSCKIKPWRLYVTAMLHMHLCDVAMRRVALLKYVCRNDIGTLKTCTSTRWISMWLATWCYANKWQTSRLRDVKLCAPQLSETTSIRRCEKVLVNDGYQASAFELYWALCIKIFVKNYLIFY